jgi:hypothetical protein
MPPMRWMVSNSSKRDGCQSLRAAEVRAWAVSIAGRPTSDESVRRDQPQRQRLTCVSIARHHVLRYLFELVDAETAARV